MKFKLVPLALLLMSSLVSAEIPTLNIQRCYFSRLDYQVGLFSPLAREIAWNEFMKNRTEDYIVKSFFKLQDIPAAYLQPGGQLEELLRARLIAVARMFQNGRDTYEVIVMDKRSFAFLREYSTLEGLILITDYYGGDWAVLQDMISRKVPVEVLTAKLNGPVEVSEAVCNWL